MPDVCDDLRRMWPLPNVWLGTSVEDQPRADQRIPHLLRCPASLRFLSCEPLLGPIDFYLDGIGWVIIGGESGPGARECNIEWIRSLIEQCRESETSCFVKQVGAQPFEEQGQCSRWPRGTGVSFDEMREQERVTYRLKDSKGGDPAEWPEDLRVREYPTVTTTV